MPEISRGRALAYVLALVVLLAVGGRLLGLANGPGGDDRTAPGRRAAIQVEREPARKLVVHVVGAVENPGLYRLVDGSRVDDAIRHAGGAKAKAALELVNLAAPVADGQQVVVPVRGSAAPASTPGPAATSPSAGVGVAGSAGGRVHLNSATLEQLDALPGIGPVTAQKILDYRTQHGAFSSIEELDAVPGIGPARFEQLKPLVDL